MTTPLIQLTGVTKTYRTGELAVQVLHGIDPSVLAIAMKGSSDAVIETIRKNLSERNRDFLDDEVKTMGPVRVSQVEESRAEIVKSIRELEAKGSIKVQRGDEDEYVY